MTKPVLYHMPQTRGQTTLWMNEELGDVCEIRLINLKSDDQKTDDFLSINPLGKIPTLVDEGHIVTEAAAICAHLADRFSSVGLAPSLDDARRGPYFRFMFMIPSCLEPSMLDKFTGTIRENPLSVGHGTFEDVTNVFRDAITFSQGPYLLGTDFSAADIVVGSGLYFATLFGALERSGAIADYLDRVTARPAYKCAEEKNAQYLKDLGIA